MPAAGIPANLCPGERSDLATGVSVRRKRDGGTGIEACEQALVGRCWGPVPGFRLSGDRAAGLSAPATTATPSNTNPTNTNPFQNLTCHGP